MVDANPHAPEYQGPVLTWKPRIGAEEPKEDTYGIH